MRRRRLMTTRAVVAVVADLTREYLRRVGDALRAAKGRA